MCGIIGYVGEQNATPILIDGLARLEYRGYDSAGIAVLDSQGAIVVHKRAGKLRNLSNAISSSQPHGVQGIGHTRWATHGEPNDINAHPHVDCTGDLALIHNGIIENYQELRKELMAEGHVFTSQTDTEILAHAIERELAQGAENLETAVRNILPKLRGAYAMVVMSRKEPGKLIGARNNAPLIIGAGNGESYFASDMTALLKHTRSMLTLNDGEYAVITAADIRIHTIDGKQVQRTPIHVEWDAQSAEKDGYPHYLLKEIMEQPAAAQRALLSRIKPLDDRLVPQIDEIDALAQSGKLKNISRIIMLACGTSYYASLIGRAMLERWARIPVEPWVASEFRYADPVVGPDTLVIAITQSGETADTIASVRLAKESGAVVVGLTNMVGSALTREVDVTLYLNAGPEISVPATKTFVTSVMTLTVLALKLAELRDTLDAFAITSLLRQVETIPAKMEKLLEIVGVENNTIQQTAKWLAPCQSAMFIGRGSGYAVAREGALKLKEVSYIHAEGYQAGELKHGPITLLDEFTPLLAVATHSIVYEKVISNIQEVRARRAKVIAVATEGDELIHKHAESVFYVPEIDELLVPALAAIPFQLLAYYTAVERGCDIDQPRNLAKSVTVE